METATFELRQEPLPELHTVIVKLSGSIDAHNAPRLEQALTEVVEAGVRNVILDLSDLQYISSAGLGVFMVLYEDVEDRGGKVVFAALPPKVHTVFDLLGFTQLFPFFTTVEEARQYLMGQRGGADD